MRTGARIASVAAVAAAMLAVASPAFADSADNDGINALEDNNLSVIPVQACGNNVAVLAIVLPILSPQADKCVNAPIVDHPSAG
ncbi:hypothetical protein [Saccharopolyspora sp. 5N708]|uniref:hypothetical protein n=1 Tax=Saccharopolyspora sp. 5N708 TaxID=3457424 RepID=UPI003FD06C6A